MSRTFAKFLVVAVLLAAVAAGCKKKEQAPARSAPEAGAASRAAETPAEGAAAPAEKPSKGIKVKVGVVIPLSGDIATYGDEAKKGIMLAAEEARAQGKVAPEMLIVDNGGAQQKTVTTVKQFVDMDRVDVIIGAITSNNTLAAGDRAEAARVAMVSPAATNKDITLNKRYVFRVCFTDEFQGKAAADFAYDTLGARRAAILVNAAQSYSKGLGDVLSSAFKRRGGEIVSVMSFTPDTDDFGGQITQLRLKMPDVVFLPSYYEAAAKCISQARTAGLRATFVGTDGWDSPKLYELSAGAVKGNYFTTHFSPDEDRAAAKRFVQNYRAAYQDEPGAIAALSYDAAAVVFDAVGRAGSADRQAIADALERTKGFPGVSGTFAIDENHNAVKSLVVLETGESGAALKEVITP
ncbi:MAG: ABC transporter substrate-binding protein [Planctomycetes bacterium]|nr:ABC transporter substrate-binding protein [Planctomycetota bacterium]